jgi:hypothetical protein
MHCQHRHRDQTPGGMQSKLSMPHIASAPYTTQTAKRITMSILKRIFGTTAAENDLTKGDHASIFP